MSQKLKPCVMCRKPHVNLMGYDYHRVSCSNSGCPISYLALTKQEWNTRVEPEQLTHKQILESCIDIKEQKVVSLTRLAEVLGVEMLTKEQVSKLVDSRKAQQLKESKMTDQNLHDWYLQTDSGGCYEKPKS